MSIRSVAFALAFSATVSTASAQLAESNPMEDMWDDPRFKKSFLGSYGFLSGAEPDVSQEEVETLRDLFPVIERNPSVAIDQLEPKITQDSTAAFDFILGNLYFQKGELGQAETNYEAAIDKFPEFRRAYKNLGLVQVQQGDFKRAIETLSKAMELGEVEGRAYGLLGYSYLSLERYYPAEAAYRQAILMQPETRDWKVGLARALLESERHKEAIALFDTLLKDDPRNADFWMLQSNAYIALDQPMKAAKNLEIVRRLGAADVAGLSLLGDIYMNHEAPELALDAYLAAADKASPDNLETLLRAAELFTRTGDHTQASEMIAKLRDEFGERLADDQSLQLLTFEARVARAQGKEEKAVELLKDIVKRDTLNGDALIELANHYADEAENLRSKIERQTKSSSEAEIEKLKNEAAAMLSKAVTRYEQAAKIDGFERRAVVAHAQALVRAGDYSDAIPLIERALEIKKDANLSDYLERVQRAAEAASEG